MITPTNGRTHCQQSTWIRLDRRANPNGLTYFHHTNLIIMSHPPMATLGMWPPMCFHWLPRSVLDLLQILLVRPKKRLKVRATNEMSHHLPLVNKCLWSQPLVFDVAISHKPSTESTISFDFKFPFALPIPSVRWHIEPFYLIPNWPIVRISILLAYGITPFLTLIQIRMIPCFIESFSSLNFGLESSTNCLSVTICATSIK